MFSLLFHSFIMKEWLNHPFFHSLTIYWQIVQKDSDSVQNNSGYIALSRRGSNHLYDSVINRRDGEVGGGDPVLSHGDLQKTAAIVPLASQGKRLWKTMRVQLHSLILCGSMDCSLPGSPVHGVF